MRRLSLMLGLMALVIIALVPAASAQSMFGTVTGTAKDAAGAVVPGANVTVKSNLTGDVRTSVTNGAGYFSVGSLPAGTYTVTVEAKGFAKFIVNDLLLNASDTKTLNIDLKIQTGTEKVEVVSSASEIALADSIEKSATIQQGDLEKLSLMSRNATEFVKIMPGATLAAQGAVNKPATNGMTIGINGFVPDGSNAGGLGNNRINGQTVDITQDGQHVFDPGASGDATPVNPNPSMISEVKVLTASFTSENAKGPVMINTVTKGGGSAFHGEGRFNVRNDAMNSTDHFNKQIGLGKPASSYYYPGFNLGGPIPLPFTSFNKNRNKLFFFESFEYYKQTIDSGVVRAFVPTADMLNGNFTGADTLGAGRFAMGTIPTMPNAGVYPGWDTRYNAGCRISAAGVLNSACIDPNAQNLLKAYVPAPNVDANTHAGFNYQAAFSPTQNAYQNVMRTDFAFSDNTKVYVIWSAQRETAQQPFGLWNGSGDWVVPAPSATLAKNTSDNLGITFLKVFSPTMTSETRFGWVYIDMPSSPSDPAKVSRKDIPGGFAYKGIYGNAMTPAVLSWGQSIPNLGDVGHDAHPDFTCNKGLPSFSENFTKVLKTHETKYGFYYEHTFNKQDNWGQYMGVFTYDPWNTISGNNYADILMGIGFNGYFEQALPEPTSIAQNIWAAYAQDQWRVNRRLTINYGMRFEHYAKPYAANDWGLAMWDPGRYNPNSTPNDNTGVLWHSLNASIPMSGADSRFLFFSPRVGAAIDIFGNGKTIIRGGWGKYRAYDSLQSNAYTGPAQTAMGSVGLNCNGLRAAAGTSDAVNCSTWAGLENLYVGPPTSFGQSLGPGLKGISVQTRGNDEQPLVTSYSLNLDQRLPGKFMAELSYVGNHTDFSQATVNLNAIPLGTLHLLANQAAPGGGSCSAPAGGGTPWVCDGLQALRPYKNYQGMTGSVTAGKAQYDAFQAEVKRNVGWLSLMANYSFSKALGSNGWNVANGTMNAILPDYGTSTFWGILPLNRAHAFNVAYVLTVPKFQSKFLNGVAGGWQISGITQIQSGAQLSNQSGSTGLNFNYGRTNATDGDGNTTIYYDAAHLLGTPDITLYPLITCNPAKGNPEGRFMNPNCFAPAPAGQLGSTHMPYLPGPRYWNSDISVQKTFNITERQKVEFRFSAFNFMNHGLLSFGSGRDAHLDVGFDAAGNVNNATDSAHACPGPQCTAMGYATNHYGHRTLELGMRYTF